MAKIAAIVFDLDGVLIDATEWHYEALNRALALFGFTITRYEHLSTYNGLPTRRKLEMLTAEKGLPAALHDLIRASQAGLHRDEIVTRCRPVFEREYMLSRLKCEGYRLAVCSNAVRDSVELMLRRAGLLSYFEFVLSNEDVLKPKPDPEGLSAARWRSSAARRRKSWSSKTRPTELRAARAAGLQVCHVGGVQDVDYFRVRDFIDGPSSVRASRHDSDCRPHGRRRPALRRARLHVPQAAHRGRRPADDRGHRSEPDAERAAPLRVRLPQRPPRALRVARGPAADRARLRDCLDAEGYGGRPVQRAPRRRAPRQR